MSNSNKPDWLHRSKDWGTTPHVNIGRSHGHSPTIVPPGGVGPRGTISIGRPGADIAAGKFSRHLPLPYGPFEDRFRRDK